MSKLDHISVSYEYPFFSNYLFFSPFSGKKLITAGIFLSVIDLIQDDWLFKFNSHWELSPRWEELQWALHITRIHLLKQITRLHSSSRHLDYFKSISERTLIWCVWFIYGWSTDINRIIGINWRLVIILLRCQIFLIWPSE